MLHRTGCVLLLLAALSSVAQAAFSTTKSSTSTFLLPSISTSASEHIYATLITADDATTLWALGCQPDVSAATPTCTGAFRPRRTLTSGPSTMHLELGDRGGGSSDYDCTRALADSGGSSSPFTCRINSGPAAQIGAAATATTTTLTAAGAWMTPVTVIGDAARRRKKTTHVRTTTIVNAGNAATSTLTETVDDATATTAASSQKPTTTSGGNGEACKRDVVLEKRKSGTGAGTGGSTAGDGTTGDGAEGGSAGTPGATKGNKNGHGCSAASRVEGGWQFISGMAGVCLLVLVGAI
ncbi:hypothetical protein PG993_011158 [Apiospora rasikravindrae]|uniref:Uncharacterized protein n=1 Tax=Apiospora rasikravindrae TaxID=990691 RepID=A0ABR1SDE7_9PEZI